MEVIKLDIDDMVKIFPLIKQLRVNLNFDDYVKNVKTMKLNGYQTFGLYVDGEIVSFVGFAEAMNLYYGNHIWVYDLVTDESKRGRGYGKQLLSFVEQYAKMQKIIT